DRGEHPGPRASRRQPDGRQAKQRHQRGTERDRDRGGERIELALDAGVPAGMARSSKQHGSEDESVHVISPASRSKLERDDLSLNCLLVPFVPAEAGTQFFGRVLGPWIPACAGMNGDWLTGGANLHPP